MKILKICFLLFATAFMSSDLSNDQKPLMTPVKAISVDPKIPNSNEDLQAQPMNQAKQRPKLFRRALKVVEAPISVI